MNSLAMESEVRCFCSASACFSRLLPCFWRARNCSCIFSILKLVR